MKKLLFILLIIGGLIMLRPINAIIKDNIGNIIHRGFVVTGKVAVDNGDGSYDVYIAGEAKAYPKIFTLARNPDLAIGDTVRILYKNGCKELPIILPPVKPTAPPEEYELIFNQSYRASTSATSRVSYADAHNKSLGDAAFGNPSGLLSKQVANFPSGSYLRWDIYRPFLYWDTSDIPAGATITAAEIQIYIRLKWTYRTFNIVVQNGQPTYPHNPVIKADYYHVRYSGNGGSIASGDIVTNAWNTITLNADGKDWINCGGETKLALRVSRDIDSDSPGAPAEGDPAREEGIQLYGEPAGYILYAKLVIKYIL